MRWLVVMLVVGVLTGCAAAPATEAQSVPVRAVYTDVFCGEPAAGLTWLDDEAAVDDYLDQSRPLEAQPLPEVESLAYASHAVVAVSMGRRSSGGYAVSLNETEAVVEGGVLTLLVEWQMPEPGNINAQMISQPCVLIAVPRAGFDTIVVSDDSGVERGRLTR